MSGGSHLQRLSQDDGIEGDSNSIQNQKAILQKFAEDHHFPSPCFYVDDGFSGGTFQRPAFQQMISDMENGEIGIIVTKDLSRLGRNQLHTGLYIEERFPMFGVRYIAINDNVDTDSNENRILTVLMENKGKIVSRDALMARLWETDAFVDENTLSVNITRLRRKLAAVGAEDLIKTRKGMGYLIE